MLTGFEWYRKGFVRSLLCQATLSYSWLGWRSFNFSFRIRPNPDALSSSFCLLASTFRTSCQPKAVIFKFGTVSPELQTRMFDRFFWLHSQLNYNHWMLVRMIGVFFSWSINFLWSSLKRSLDFFTCPRVFDDKC